MTTHTPTDWRERAVSRSLGGVRLRAEERLERLMAAAEEIMSEGGEVTVQEVVARAGQSLRTFYQHFATKHDLLLALLEAGCDELAVAVERTAGREQDPVAALRAGIALLHKANRPQRSPKRRALVQFSAQLLHTDPVAYQQVQQCIVDALRALVSAASPEARDPLRTAAVVLNVIQGTARRDVLLVAQGFKPVAFDELWSAVGGLLHPGVAEVKAA